MNSRQDRVPQPRRAAAESRGGYVLVEAASGRPEVILIATGGEVPVALRAREILEAGSVPTRVVAMPCQESFDGQSADYRESVLPKGVGARVSVASGSPLGWYALLGEAGVTAGPDRCGLSAPYQALYEQVGFAAERVAAQARRSLAAVSRRAA